MSRDPYQVLGVSRDAGASDIKKAYRKLAKRWHPDANADDPKARERFAEASNAYELLSDKDKRTRFDRGEIDADGNPRMQGFEGFRPGATHADASGFGPGGMRWSFSRGGGGGGGFDPDDILSEIFGGGARRQRGRTGARGQDVALALEIELAEAARGATKRARLPNGKDIDIKIPLGIESGKQIRLKGQGMPGLAGGPPGDALVTVTIRPHPDFTVEGSDLRRDISVPLETAVLGGKVRVPTLEGTVDVKIPAHVNGRRTMRLKGKGLPKADGGRGDLLASLRIVLPETPDEDLEALMRDRQSGRAAVGGKTA